MASLAVSRGPRALAVVVTVATALLAACGSDESTAPPEGDGAMVPAGGSAGSRADGGSTSASRGGTGGTPLAAGASGEAGKEGSKGGAAGAGGDGGKGGGKGGAAGVAGSGGKAGKGGGAGSSGKGGAAGAGGKGGAAGTGGKGGGGAGGGAGNKAGDLCDACKGDKDCGEGACRVYTGYPELGGFCSPETACATDAECLPGWSCSTEKRCWVTTAWGCDGNNRVLVDNCDHVLESIACKSGELCTGAGVCAPPAGKLELCATCTKGGDCVSGQCSTYANSPQLGGFCAPAQTPCTSDSQCAAGWACNKDTKTCWVTTKASCQGNDKVVTDNCGRALSTTPCGAGQTCSGAGTCAGTLPLCASCNTPSECASGYCGASPSRPEDGKFCYPGAQSCSQCPSGWACGAAATCWVTLQSVCSGDGWVLQDNCGHPRGQSGKCTGGSTCSNGQCITKSCSSSADCPGDCSGSCCPGCKTYSDGSRQCAMICG